MKLNASKLQQSGAFVIEHLKKNQPFFQKNRCTIQKRVRIANKWKKNNSCLFPKATDILQKERRVGPTVFSELDKILQSVQYIVPVRRENSCRNSISPAKQNWQWINSIRQSPPDGSKRRNPKNIRSAKSRHHKARSVLPHSQETNNSCAAQLGVLELLKQPEGMSCS